MYKVENKIRENIIPTTKTWGIVSAIIGALGFLLSGQIMMAIVFPIIYYGSVLALIVLLDGYAEIISLLRNIADNTNSAQKQPLEAARVKQQFTATPAKPPIPRPILSTPNDFEPLDINPQETLPAPPVKDRLNAAHRLLSMGDSKAALAAYQDITREHPDYLDAWRCIVTMANIEQSVKDDARRQVERISKS